MLRGCGQDLRDSGLGPGRAGGHLSPPSSFAESPRFMRGILHWVTRAVLVRGVPRAGGLPEDPGRLVITASPTQRAPMFRLPRGARGARPWSGRMQTGFRALLRGLPVRWCPGISVSGVAPSPGNGFLHWPVPLLRERSVWDEGQPACFVPIRGLTSESEPSSLLPLCAGLGGRAAGGC